MNGADCDRCSGDSQNEMKYRQFRTGLTVTTSDDQRVNPAWFVMGVALAVLVLTVWVFFSPSLSPSVLDSVVLRVQRPDAGRVLEDAELARWLSGDALVPDDTAVTAACHALLGHAGDWTLNGNLVVSTRSDLVRVAEMVSSGEVDVAVADAIESVLFGGLRSTGPGTDDVATLARLVSLPESDVEDYVRLRERRPSPAALMRFVAYVSNPTTTSQQLVLIDMDKLDGVSFDGVLGSLDSGMLVAGSQTSIAVDRDACNRLSDAGRAG